MSEHAIHSHLKEKVKQFIIPYPLRATLSRFSGYWNAPLHNYHRLATNRYLSYSMMTLLTGIFTFLALACYARLNPSNATTLAFKAIYAWETALNFGICLLIIDTCCGYSKATWGGFKDRTVSRTYTIWFGAYILAFTVERTLVFWSLALYAPEITEFFKKFPEFRPAYWESFFYCLPFWFTIAFFLINNAFRQELKLKTVDSRNLNTWETSQDLKEKSRERVRLKIGKTIEYLRIADISHINIEDHYSRIFIRNGNSTKEILKKISLSRLLAQLPRNQFLQIHRSYAVNIDYISRVKKTRRSYEIVLGQVNLSLPISRYRVSQLLPVLEQRLLQPRDGKQEHP